MIKKTDIVMAVVNPLWYLAFSMKLTEIKFLDFFRAEVTVRTHEVAGNVVGIPVLPGHAEERDGFRNEGHGIDYDPRI